MNRQQYTCATVASTNTTSLSPMLQPLPNKQPLPYKHPLNMIPEHILPNIEYNPSYSLLFKGYCMTRKLANTLQGSIWYGTELNGDFNTEIVIKITNKQLCDSFSTIQNGRKLQIEENIISEMKTLKYLTSCVNYGICKYITTYIDFFADQTNYFLLMTNGGSALFGFVQKAHKCIVQKTLLISEWQRVCKILFAQIIDFLDILHHKLNVCHMDISLENILINDVLITTNPKENDLVHFVPKFNIKFCDFGLSESFDPIKNPKFLSNKFVGKLGYKCPEIHRKTPNFSAKSADIWSAGVCFFALCIGSMPFTVPCMTDPTFQWIIGGHIKQMLAQWKKEMYISDNALDCIQKIFQYQKTRITTSELLKHSYLS